MRWMRWGQVLQSHISAAVSRFVVLQDLTPTERRSTSLPRNMSRIDFLPAQEGIGLGTSGRISCLIETTLGTRVPAFSVLQ